MSNNPKVIFESKADVNMSQEEQIDRQIKILQYMKEGYPVEFRSGGSWLPKTSTLILSKPVTYRVLEKKKEVKIYTIIYQNNNQILSWSTTNEEEYKSEICNFNSLYSFILLKTHIDTVEIQ
jgi:hypothetical protein